MAIPRKLKPCKTCHDPKYLFSAGNCLECYNRLKLATKPIYKNPSLKQADKQPAKPFRVINKVSPKQAKLNAIYNVAATQFKKDNQHCMAKLHGCTVFTQHVHHLHSGASRSKYFLDSTTWLPVCHHCHQTIHDVLSKEDAVNMGFKKIE